MPSLPRSNNKLSKNTRVTDEGAKKLKKVQIIVKSRKYWLQEITSKPLSLHILYV